MIMKTIAAGFAALLFTGTVVTQQASAQRSAYYESTSGTAEVRVSPGGYGFAGELGPDGRWRGVTTEGAAVNDTDPNVPGVKFFNANDPQQLNDNVPFVRFDRFGRPSVDLSKGTSPHPGVVRLPGPPRPDDYRLKALVSEGQAEEAYRLAMSLPVGGGYGTITPKAVASLAFRFGDYETAAKNIRYHLKTATYGPLTLLDSINWRDVKPYFETDDAYCAAFAMARHAEPTADQQLVLAYQSLVIGRTDLARPIFEALAANDRDDRLVRKLLDCMPPEVH